MYKSSDGKGFTNRPPMMAHEASLKARKPEHAAPEHEEGMHSGEMVTCPACGHEFENDNKEERAEEQVHPGIHEQIHEKM